MEPRKDGGPAFPIKGYMADASGAFSGEVVNAEGISARDYFAVQALPLAFEACGPNKQGWNGVAGVAYSIADAMLKARAKA